MKIDDQDRYITATELEVMGKQLPLAGKRVLELGCGQAVMTRQIADSLSPAEIIATEVDRTQHEKNLQIGELPGVRFLYGGAQQIDLEDQSVDAVIMLKSLHHVPMGLMAQALQEIHRVLRRGALAYFSEPVYRGPFNDIMRLFHDEKTVRIAAFEALRTAVEKGLFESVTQIFFNAPGEFRDFEEFERRMIHVTHTRHRIDPPLQRKIRTAFDRHLTKDGAYFLKPSRVDILRKPAAG